MSQPSRVVVYLPENNDLPGLEWYEWTTEVKGCQFDRNNLHKMLAKRGIFVVTTGDMLLKHIHNCMFMGWKAVNPPGSTAHSAMDPESIQAMKQWWMRSIRISKSAKVSDHGSRVPVPAIFDRESNTAAAWVICARRVARCCRAKPGFLVRCRGDVCPPRKALLAGDRYISPDGTHTGSMARIAPALWFVVPLLIALLYSIGHVFFERYYVVVPWVVSADVPLFGVAATLVLSAVLMADASSDLDWKYQHSAAFDKILLAKSLSADRTGGLPSGSSSSSSQLHGQSVCVSRETSRSNPLAALGDNSSRPGVEDWSSINGITAAARRATPEYDIHDDDDGVYEVLSEREKLRFAFMIGKPTLYKTECPEECETESIRLPHAVRNAKDFVRDLGFETMTYEFVEDDLVWDRNQDEDDRE